MAEDLHIKILEPLELPSILTLAAELNPNIDLETLDRRLSEMAAQNFECVGGFLDEELVAIAGLWITTRFYSGKQIEVDNVIVHPDMRSTGIGNQLMQWIYDYGRSIGCDTCELNTYVANSASHKFYLNEGFDLLGLHLQKKL